jgi:hypothetical protein
VQNIPAAAADAASNAASFLSETLSAAGHWVSLFIKFPVFLIFIF